MFKKLLDFLKIEIIDEPVKVNKSKSEVKDSIQNAYLQYNKPSGFVVYHIYKTRGDLSSGYIGVTSNFEARKIAHFEALENKCHENKALQAAYNRHEFNRNSMITLFQGLTEDGAYSKENELRPRYHMGWNLNQGGKFATYETSHFRSPSRSNMDFSSPVVINKQSVREGSKSLWNGVKSLPSMLEASVDFARECLQDVHDANQAEKKNAPQKATESAKRKSNFQRALEASEKSDKNWLDKYK